MFRLKYTKLFAVKILHPYYKDSISPDFSFIPLDSSRKAMESLGLRHLLQNGQLVIYQQQQEDGTPEVELTDGVDLFFSIQVQTDILNITESLGQGRYWFSNLREDGTLQNQLTFRAIITESDELPPVMKQSARLPIEKEEGIQKITLARTLFNQGSNVAFEKEIASTDFFIDLNLPNPGKYTLSRISANSTTTQISIFSDELSALSNYWGILHLHISPDLTNREFYISLQAKLQKWQYLIAEAQTSGMNPTPSAGYRITYNQSASRYPANVAFSLLQPASYPEELKRTVSTIKASPAIKAVHVIESDAAIPILEGKSPIVTLWQNNELKSKKLDVPNRKMKQARLNLIL